MEDYLKESDDSAKHSSSEVFKNWRLAVSLVKNRRRRFRHVADLEKRKDIQLFKLKDILSGTNNFSDENLINEGALGKVYKGQLLHNGNSMNCVVQSLDCKYGQGEELQKEISLIRHLRNNNIASVYGYCYENNENILVYKAFHGTLNQRLKDTALTWYQRLLMCLGVASGLNHIHYDVIHCDINSSKIILNKYWKPMIYGFELSTEYPQSWRHRLLFSSYFDTDNLTPKYDVYSFGVLLLEVLCGRKPTITNDGVVEDVDEIIDPILRKQMNKDTLALFKNTAYKCLSHQHAQRPTMDEIVKELKEVLEIQLKHENTEHSKAGVEEGMPSNVDVLEIPLNKIRLATKNFSNEYLIGAGGYGEVYRAKLELGEISKTVAIKRIFSRPDGQDKQGFDTEIKLLKCCKHQNIVSLLGFSIEALQMVLVYEYAFKGSLSGHLEGIGGETINLTWVQRIQICLDIAYGISYLHTDMEGKPRIIHRDIKSDNILLDENLNAKIADFGLSKSHDTNQLASTGIYSKNIVGTCVYMDPEYSTTGTYRRESDIYSFGVVLFEVLSGSLAYDSVYTNENEMGLAPIARRRYNEGTLKELIDPKIIKEDDDRVFTLNRGPNQDSFHTFSKVAYECLADTQAKRPTIEVIIEELQNALKLQGDTIVLFRYPLDDIVLATKNFSETCYIGSDTNGMVYKAELGHFDSNSSLRIKGKNNGEHITAAVKRITNRKGMHGKQEFLEELEVRAIYKHPNIVSLLGFCDQRDEMILVSEHVSDISLDDYLKCVDNRATFTWTHRLHVCLEIARGLNHIHTMMVKPQRIIKGDIKSANIYLGKNSEAKIAYFAISKLAIDGKLDMEVYETKRKSDIYSFGVVLFEIFCGRVAYDPIYIKENDEGLAHIAHQCFHDKTIKSIMDIKLKEDISHSNRGPNEDSLDTFLEIANQCLGEPAKRPAMELVIKELEKALQFQDPKHVEFVYC